MSLKWRIAFHVPTAVLFAAGGLCYGYADTPEVHEIDPALAVFGDPTAGYEEKLDFLLEHSELVAEALRLHDCAELATQIGDAVGLAPFTAKREAAFRAVLKMAEDVLDQDALATAPLSVLEMPLRSLLLGRGEVVNPGYGKEEISTFLLKYSRHPVPEVRLVVMRQLFGIWQIDTVTKDKLREFLEQQVAFELALQGDKDLDTARLEGILGIAVQLRDVFLMPGRPTLPVISDVEFQKRLRMTRKELLKLALTGDYFAWEMIRRAPFTIEEEEVLFNALTSMNTEWLKQEMLRALTRGIRKDRPAEAERARIDRILVWYRENKVQTDPYAVDRRQYVRMLYDLGREGRDGTVSREYESMAWQISSRLHNGEVLPPDARLYNAEIHLERRQGEEVIALLELFLSDSNKDVKRDTERALRLLRAIYQTPAP